ncbi:MAG: response regulator [Bacteroidales bacterium]|nr:response regulator [Bacteroidales bacterium]MCF8389321.1 response regulator [Bacteroidales bacterium]
MRKLFLIFYLIIPFFLSAETSFAEEIRFKQITSEEGLSQSEIYCFLQDRKGYMWFGTLDGLNKYDGYSITTYTINSRASNSLMHNTIYSLAEDKFGRIWIGTGNGINLFDPISQQFFALPDFYFGKQLIVRNLLADDNNLWIGTYRGLFRLSLTNDPISEESLVKIIQDIDHVDLKIMDKTFINSSVNKISKGADGKIWIGAWEGISCFEYSVENENQFRFPELPENLQEIREINDMVIDSSGLIWIGTQDVGLYRFREDNDQLKRFSSEISPGLLSNNIKALVVDLSGNIWLGNYKDGLNRIDSQSSGEENIEFAIYQNNEFQTGSLNSNLIRSLFVSRDGMLWIGTLGKGINTYDPYQKLFKIIRIPPLDQTGKVNNFIRAVYKDSDQNLWLGMHFDGLIKYDYKRKEFKKMGLDKTTIFHIYPVDKNHLWLATNSGAHLVEIKNDEVKIVSSLEFKQLSDVFAYNACFNIERSSDNIFWIASMSGVVRVEMNSDYSFEKTLYDENSSPAISFNNTRVLKYDKKNNTIWAGTEGGGLNQIILDDDQFPEKIIPLLASSDEPGRLSSNYIRSLCVDKKDQLWVGTYEGLNLVKTDLENGKSVFKTWKMEDGLPNNMIQSILEDDDGHIWLGTNGGLSKFNIEKKSFSNYKISDGLQSNEFSEHASFKSEYGEFIFGGINGVNVFYPDEIGINPLSPSAVITDFYLFNEKVIPYSKENSNSILLKSIDITDSLILKANQNDLRFDFSALYFSDPEKIQYEYIMRGYDNDWITTTASKRSANYTNLNFGKYIFEVRATNSDGVWSDDTARIFIHIQTPFWLKWWAVILYILTFGLIVFYFANFSIIKIATKKQLILDNEHNQRLHELENLRTRFFINMSHDLRTPLTLITGPLENILKNLKINEELRSQLDMVNRSAKRLRYRVEQLLDIRKFETGNLKPKLKSVEIVEFIKNEAILFELAIKDKGLNYNINSPEEKIVAFIDKDIVGKVLFNLLSNSLKYTEQGEITVNFESIPATNLNHLPFIPATDFYIMIEVQDSGSGMSEEKTEKIFERFYQDPESTVKGYGIGLSHTKDLIESHQGYIHVKSKKGFGSSFIFYLPLYSELEENVSKEVQTKSPTLLISLETAVTETNEPLYPENAESILLVEDNADMRSYLKSVLSKNYKIFEAVNGQEGHAIAMKESPSLIVSDIMMPIMDGFEFCAKIKSNIETSHIPIILLTAKVDAETKFKSIELGADDYIPKPFDIDYLCLRIKKILQLREQLRNLFQKNILLEPSEVTVTSSDELFLKKLIETIEEGIPDPEFSVESMEKILGMSHTNFYRKIKTITGQSGKELLQNMRLHRAVQLIMQQKLRISEVAYMVGFTNPKYFSKCFKVKYGVRPSDYKG